MKFEHTRVFNFEGALRGMRNPLNSWHLSDSAFGLCEMDYVSGYIDDVAEVWKDNGEDKRDWLTSNGIIHIDDNYCEYAFLGPKDLGLAQRLIAGGSEHRKFLRQIFVSVDITAPLFWLKEADTYKVATTANSTSTMHKLASTPITAECFEMEPNDFTTNTLIPYLESLRQEYNETKNPDTWKRLIQTLPDSWKQTRTWTGSYETVRNMCHQRVNHKLTEWRDDFMKWAAQLPYAQEFLLTQ